MIKDGKNTPSNFKKIDPTNGMSKPKDGKLRNNSRNKMAHFEEKRRILVVEP
jgi:hypothetical protein